MITTLTVNPSIDVTVSVDRLEFGEVHRVPPRTSEAAGKGVNVATALMSDGLDAQAIVVCGRSEGSEYLRLLESGGVPSVVIESGTTPRTNIGIIETDGRTTKLNEPGEELGADTVDGILTSVAEAVAGCEWLVASGSLPPGVPTDFYARLAEQIGDCRLAVDVSGEPLKAVLDVPAVTLKPNLDELAAVWPHPIETIDHALSAAREIVSRGAGAVLVSLGADGALLVTQGRALLGSAPTDDVRNTVGAGDSMLAGYVAGMGRSGGDPEDALRSALAWGRAAVRAPGTGLDTVTDADYAAVTIETLTGGY